MSTWLQDDPIDIPEPPVRAPIEGQPIEKIDDHEFVGVEEHCVYCGVSIGQATTRPCGKR